VTIAPVSGQLVSRGAASLPIGAPLDLTSVESTVSGDINLLGILGLSDEVRDGYERIQVSFNVRGYAPEEKLRALVEQSRARSAVFDILTNSVPVDIDITTV
jgi:hypothetical protein